VKKSSEACRDFRPLIYKISFKRRHHSPFSQLMVQLQEYSSYCAFLCNCILNKEKVLASCPLNLLNVPCTYFFAYASLPPNVTQNSPQVHKRPSSFYVVLPIHATDDRTRRTFSDLFLSHNLPALQEELRNPHSRLTKRPQAQRSNSCTPIKQK